MTEEMDIKATGIAKDFIESKMKRFTTYLDIGTDKIRCNCNIYKEFYTKIITPNARKFVQCQLGGLNGYFGLMTPWCNINSILNNVYISVAVWTKMKFEVDVSGNDMFNDVFTICLAQDNGY